MDIRLAWEVLVATIGIVLMAYGGLFDAGLFVYALGVPLALGEIFRLYSGVWLTGGKGD